MCMLVQVCGQSRLHTRDCGEAVKCSKVAVYLGACDGQVSHQAEAELEEANAKLQEKQDALQAVMDRVAGLVAQLEQAQQEQQDLNDQVRCCRNTCTG